MNPGESPAVARRRLRLALRKAREAGHLTQAQVAEALDWSLSKVNRIENGDVTVSTTDLRALLELLDITDPARVARMAEDAKASRRRGWWDQPQYREHLTPGTLQMLQFESEATVIRTFQPVLVPGLLQTKEYAEAILAMGQVWMELSDRERAVRLEVRLRRRTQVLDKHDPPQFLVVLDESVVMRNIGGIEVMHEQLDHLLVLVKRGVVSVRILPLPDSAHFVLTGSWNVYDLGDEENAVLYRENSAQDAIDYGREQVNRYRDFFEAMWRQAMTDEASVRLMEARLASIRAELARSTQG